jgi:hypothetical protein
MRIAQRATSFAGLEPGLANFAPLTPSIDYRTADRWGFYAASHYDFIIDIQRKLGVWTQSVENDSPDGFSKSMKMLCTTGSGATITSFGAAFSSISQRIEGQNLAIFAKGTPSAKQACISFWVKANVTGTYVCEIVDADNSRSISLQYTISASGVWEKKTLTVPPDATGAFVYDNSSALEVVFYIAAGPSLTSGTLQSVWGSTTTANRAVGQVNVAATTNNYWQITGVQLEENLQPTPFEHRPIGVELALCQRYFERSYNDGIANGATTNTGTLAYIAAGLDNLASISHRFLVEKRATPTVVIWSSNGVANSANFYGAGDIGVLNVNAGTKGLGTASLATNQTLGRSGFFHYQATAEL